jgi:catechol 2,3-dioxygenase-like lactoylglutathione lyase family enzyme
VCSVIDHLGLEVRDYRRRKEFYVAALAPLGFEFAMEFEERRGDRSERRSAGERVLDAEVADDSVDRLGVRVAAVGAEQRDLDLRRPHLDCDTVSLLLEVLEQLADEPRISNVHAQAASPGRNHATP